MNEQEKKEYEYYLSKRPNLTKRFEEPATSIVLELVQAFFEMKAEDKDAIAKLYAEFALGVDVTHDVWISEAGKSANSLSFAKKREKNPIAFWNKLFENFPSMLSKVHQSCILENEDDMGRISWYIFYTLADTGSYSSEPSFDAMHMLDQIHAYK